MKNTKIEGVLTAIVTPFKENLEIDWQGYERIIHAQVDAGVSGVVAFGTTGESPTLESEEKIALIEKAIEASGGKLQIMAGTGSNNTKDSIALSLKAKQAGATSLLIVTPPYNKPSVAGLIQHYKAIGDAVDLPICLYHVPARTGQLLNADQICQIVEAVPQITAIKEASGDLALFARLTQRLTSTHVLSGDDPTYLASLSVGGKGLISVSTNIFARAYVELTSAFQSADNRRAMQISMALVDFVDTMFVETNPCPVKYCAKLAFETGDFVRAPLAVVTEGSKKAIEHSYHITRKNLESIIV